MAFNQTEQEIIKYGLENGKSQDEVKTALSNYRLGITPEKTQVTSQGFGQDLVGDVKGIGTDIVESANQRAEQFGESGIVGKIGASAGFAEDVIGSAVKGAVKAVLPQSAENAVSSGIQKTAGAVADTETAQNVIQYVNKLREENPQVAEALDALTNVGMLALDVATLGASGNVAKQGVKKGAEIAGETLSKSANLAQDTLLTGVKNIDEFKDVIRGVADSSIKKSISKDVDSLIKSTKSIDRKTNQLLARNIDISENLKDPEIFKGLKVEIKKINPDEAIQTIQDRISIAMDAKSKVLPKADQFGVTVKKSDVLLEAKKWIKNQKLAPAEEKKVLSAIKKQLEDVPDEMLPSQADDFRARFRKSSRDAKGILKRDSEFAALENSFRDAVFNVTDNLPFGEQGQFAQLNDYIKNQIATSEFLDQTLRGQTVKGGKLGSYSGRIVGAVAGSGGGVFGSLVGAEVGGLLSDIITNNQLGSSIKMALVREITDSPEAIKLAEDLVKQATSYAPKQISAPVNGAVRTQLGSGKTIQIAPNKFTKGVGDSLPADSIKKTTVNRKTGDQYVKDVKTGKTQYIPRKK